MAKPTQKMTLFKTKDGGKIFLNKDKSAFKYEPKQAKTCLPFFCKIQETIKLKRVKYAEIKGKTVWIRSNCMSQEDYKIKLKSI